MSFSKGFILIFLCASACKNIAHNELSLASKFIKLDELPNHNVINDCRLSDLDFVEKAENLICLRLTDLLFENFDQEVFRSQGFKQEYAIEFYLTNTGWKKTDAQEYYKYEYEKFSYRAKIPSFLALYEKTFSGNCQVTVTEHNPFFSNFRDLPIPYREQSILQNGKKYSYEILKYSYHPLSISLSDDCSENRL